MKKFVIKSFYFALINALLAMVIIGAIHITMQYRGWTNQIDYFSIPKHTRKDILFMGSSHAWVMTHNNNQQTVEQILNKSTISIAQLNGGPVIEKAYLDYFLENDNKVQTIIYVIDPFVLYSPKYNEHNLQVLYTELNPVFLTYLLREGVANDVISYNIVKYFSLKWFYKKPQLDKKQEQIVSDISTTKINKRIQELYSDKTDEKLFIHYTKKLEEIRDLAQKRGLRVIYIIPPTLLHDPNIPELTKYLESIRKQKNATYYDFSNSITESKYFFDTDHLNSAGVEYFTKKYLLPIIKNN